MALHTMTGTEATIPLRANGDQPLTVDTALTRAASGALVESEVGTVGLEAEAHLVALDSVSDALPWSRVEPLVAAVRATASWSAVTLEPGGQVELSGRPAPEITTAVSELRADVQRARLALADLGPGSHFSGFVPSLHTRVTSVRKNHTFVTLRSYPWVTPPSATRRRVAIPVPASHFWGKRASRTNVGAFVDAGAVLFAE